MVRIRPSSRDPTERRIGVHGGSSVPRLLVPAAQRRPVSMTAELLTLQIRSRRQWRAWLAKHHTSSPGVWLVFYKAHTGVKSIRYEDTVREALCFGWIDSLIKRLDDDRYALKVTPRQPTNNTYAPRPVVPDLPVYIAKALKANSKALWRCRPVGRGLLVY